MKNLFCLYLVTGCAAFLTPGFSGCMDSDDVRESYRTFEGEMVASYVSSHSDLKEFERALRLVGAYELLESYGKYTCFIPNDYAMEQWYTAMGKRLEEMDTATVREMVYYQLIDGHSNSVDAYTTENFPEGSFPVQNMVGRYLTASVQHGTGIWSIKTGDEYASLVSPNNETLNGVVHVTDRVLEGNNDMLPDFVANNPRYSIFGQALRATGWRDSMMVLEDVNFEAPTTTTLPGGGKEIGSTPTTFYAWPKTRKYLYTCFAESDSIMKLREGIEDLDDLREYARRMYPEGANVEDETNPLNSLHKFVGYHIYDVQRAKNKLVVNRFFVSMFDWFAWFDYICDDDYRVEQYYVPMQPDMLLSVQNANVVDKDGSSSKGVPVLNCHYSPYNQVYTSVLTMQDSYEGTPIIRILNSEADQYCQNGVLHGLNNMLVFSNDVKANVFHRRLRMDIRSFMSEGINNGMIYDGDKGYNHFYTAFPDGYLKRINFKSNNSTYMIYNGTTVHDYLHGDFFRLNGSFDFTVEVGPVPAGSYEVRLSFITNKSGAVIQTYLDDMPCGIPVDSRMAAYSGDTGWIQDWLAIQESGSSRFANMGESEEDPLGLENDKNLRNHGYMKAPNSYVGINYHGLGYGDNLTARNVDTRLRKILGIVNWPQDGTHKLRLVAMRPGEFDVDYIEFMPTDLLESEDQH